MIRNASRLAATSVALFMLASPVFAQQAPQPTAGQLAAANEVAVSSGLTGAFDAMTDPLLNQLQQMNVTRPEIRQDLDQVVALIRPEVDQKKKEMVDATAKTLAARLSEAELKEIAAFYKSAAGQKWVQLQPGILDAIVRDMAIWTQRTSEFIMARAREEMGKRGHQLN
ncbi:DUF2059 domain-containing protein [Microvirga lotononidis]|uniref:DUF2059 domain-containing protein n=1 Tax=Microvirga lotononidis TaxID=864069 RepID=I4YN84_9HYPH|nr:DUF2059 domain-containing protein [Microvirga lotononidis]EIM25426.1 hypothetical protein MicloDRAFT_00061520 [Microvirga lotononidis]WQO26260.1 DUF2059 domain-containing protein [Microvirga lotononidis]